MPNGVSLHYNNHTTTPLRQFRQVAEIKNTINAYPEAGILVGANNYSPLQHPANWQKLTRGAFCRPTEIKNWRAGLSVDRRRLKVLVLGPSVDRQRSKTAARGFLSTDGDQKHRYLGLLSIDGDQKLTRGAFCRSTEIKNTSTWAYRQLAEIKN